MRNLCQTQFNKAHSDSDIETKSYRELHRPSSEFASRSDYLDHELQIMKPRRFGLNLPGRDFRFELEDLVPALAGTIGIIAMYSAVMMSWAEGLTAAWDHVNLGKDFAIEVARVEMLIPALLFCVLASGFINPKANLAGNHGPMIPLIGTIALAGAHPLALAILIGVFGLLLSFLKRRLQTGEPHLGRYSRWLAYLLGFDWYHEPDYFDSRMGSWSAIFYC